VNDRPVPVSIQILDKEYMISCPEDEREALTASARYLDRKMRETRDGGKVLGTERIAVMTALNIIHDFQQEQRSLADQSESVGRAVQRLVERIDDALGRRPPREAID
jgi:cell division protein ZapA